MNTIRRRSAWAVVLAHAAVMLPHSLAHSELGVWLSPLGTTYVAVVIVLAPFVALGLLHTNRERMAAVLLFASMTGALLFGLVSHFLLPGPDHVAWVPAGPWQAPFQLTSALLVVTEVAGAAVGVWLLLAIPVRPARNDRSSARPPAREL